MSRPQDCRRQALRKFCSSLWFFSLSRGQPCQHELPCFSTPHLHTHCSSGGRHIVSRTGTTLLGEHQSRNRSPLCSNGMFFVRAEDPRSSRGKSYICLRTCFSPAGITGFSEFRKQAYYYSSNPSVQQMSPNPTLHTRHPR